MNAFSEHHKDSIKFTYGCFDRILLNGCVQSFLDGARAQGFFYVYRNTYPVSRKVLRDVANDYQNWVTHSAQKWGVEVQDAPEGRRDEFVEPYFRNAEPDPGGGDPQGARTSQYHDGDRSRGQVASGNEVSLGEPV
jgi:hypothetical protein